MIVDVSFKPKQEKIFLGEFGHFLRIDNVHSEMARKLKEQSEGNTWFAKEVDFSRDKINFESLPPEVHRLFNLNIGYQTVMDSGVDNGYMTIIKKICSSSIWSMLYGRIGIEEQIHAESYSYALIQMFGEKASERLDIVHSDPYIQKRMATEVEVFDDVEYLCILNPDSPDEAKKKAIIKMLLGTYFMEAVKFPFSFLVTFTINKHYDSAIQGMTRLIKLIAHDELNIHVPTGKSVINTLRKEKEEGFKDLFTSGWVDEVALEMITSIVDQEIDWAHYLLDGQDIKGLNVDIAKHFIKYRAMIALRDLHFESPYNEPKSDIIDWFNDYRDINKQNTALQEASNTSYIKGSLKNDMIGEW